MYLILFYQIFLDLLDKSFMIYLIKSVAKPPVPWDDYKSSFLIGLKLKRCSSEGPYLSSSSL